MNRSFATTLAIVSFGMLLLWPAPSRAEEPGEPPVPEFATRRLGSMRMRTSSEILSIVPTMDSSALISSDGRELRGWDPRTGRLIRPHNRFESIPISYEQFLTREKSMIVFSPGNDDDVPPQMSRFGVYNMTTGTLKPGASLPHRIMNFQIHKTTFSPDATRLVYPIGKIDSFAIAEVATGRVISKFTAEKLRRSMIFAPDNQTIVGNCGTELRRYRMRDGALLGTINHPAKAQNDAQFSQPIFAPNSERFVVWAGVRDEGKQDSGSLMIVDSNTGRVTTTIAQDDRPLGFSPDAKRLWSVGDGRYTVWTVATGKAELSFDLGHSFDAVLAPDASWLATFIDESIIVYDPNTGAVKPFSAEAPGFANQLRFLPGDRLEARHLYWGGWAEWDLKTGRVESVRATNLDEPILWAVDRSVDGRTLLYEGEKRLHVVRDGRPDPTPSPVEQMKYRSHNRSALRSDGQVAFNAVAGRVERIDLKTNTTQLLPAPTMKRLIGSRLQLAQNDSFLALDYERPGHDKKLIDLYDASRGTYLRTLTPPGLLTSLLFSAEGSYLAVAWRGPDYDPTGSAIESTTIYDTATGRVCFQIAPTTVRRCLAFSRDGRMLVQAVDEKQLLIWEVASGKLRAKLPTGEEVHAVAMAGDGRTIAISAANGPILLQDAAGAVPIVPVADVAKAYRDLASDDAMLAYRTARRLALTPAETIAHLKQELRPIAAPDAVRVQQALNALASPVFNTRESALRELQTLGDVIETQLVALRAKTDSPEVVARVDRLLEQAQRTSPTTLQALRALELLEWIGTADADAIVARLAKGAPGARLTREAERTLARRENAPRGIK